MSPTELALAWCTSPQHAGELRSRSWRRAHPKTSPHRPRWQVAKEFGMIPSQQILDPNPETPEPQAPNPETPHPKPHTRWPRSLA
jgi:hypothetical protein